MWTVAASIASTIQFTRRVNVDIQFIPIVSENQEKLAISYPTEYFSARKDGGPWLMYPKAVVKQAVLLDPRVDPDTTDMSIIFNTNIPWLYTSDADGVPEGQISFRSMIKLTRYCNPTIHSRAWISINTSTTFDYTKHFVCSSQSTHESFGILLFRTSIHL